MNVCHNTCEGISTHIKLFRKELHDVLNDRTFTRKTEAFQERTQSFIHSQVMEMEGPKNKINLLTLVTSHNATLNKYKWKEQFSSNTGSVIQ